VEFLAFVFLCNVSPPEENSTTSLSEKLHCISELLGRLRLGGVVVSVLATEPKGCGFEPDQGNGFLRAITIRSTPSFGWEVKLEVPCHKILRHVKDLLKFHGNTSTKFSFPSPTLPLTPEMSRIAEPSGSTGGCQSALVDKLEVSLSQYHHTMVHITYHPGMNNRLVEAAVLRCQSHPIIANLPIYLGVPKEDTSLGVISWRQ
jgi:hypothetical protein